MKKLVVYLSTFIFLFLFAFRVNVNAVEISQNDYESLNIKRAYVVGEYIFDLSKHTPTLKDLMLAAQTAPSGDISIFEIKIARNLGGQVTKTYVDILNNETLTSFPELNVKYVYNSEVIPDNSASENKTNLTELFGYSVKFMDGEDILYEVNLDDGETLNPPSNTSKTGYLFDNWYTSAEFATLYNFSDSISTNVNIYGKWIPNQYTINFDDNTDETVENMPESITKTYGVNSTQLLQPERAGYTFLGWSSDSNSLTATYPSNIINRDLTTGRDAQTLFAIWQDTPVNYQIQIRGRGRQCIDENSDGICDKDEDDNIIYVMDSDDPTKYVTNYSNLYSTNQISNTTFDINSIEGLTERFKSFGGYEFIGWFEVAVEHDQACITNVLYNSITEDGEDYYCSNTDKLYSTPIDLSQPITVNRNIKIHAVFEPIAKNVGFNFNGGFNVTESGLAKINRITTKAGEDLELPVLTSDDLTFPANTSFYGWSIEKNICTNESISTQKCATLNDQNKIVLKNYYADDDVIFNALWDYNKVTVNYKYYIPSNGINDDYEWIMGTDILTKGTPYTLLNASELNYTNDAVEKLDNYYENNNRTLLYWFRTVSDTNYNDKNNNLELYPIGQTVNIPVSKRLFLPSIDLYPIARYNDMVVEYYESAEDIGGEYILPSSTASYGQSFTFPDADISAPSGYIWTGWKTIDLLDNSITGVKSETINNFNYNAINDNKVAFVPTFIPDWYDEEQTEYTVDGTTITFSDILLILPRLNNNPNNITIYVNEDNATAVGNPTIGSNVTMIFGTNATLMIGDSITVEGTLKLQKTAMNEIDIASENNNVFNTIIVKNNGKLFVNDTEELISNSDNATIKLGTNSIVEIGTDNLGIDVISIFSGSATINKSNNLGRDENKYTLDPVDCFYISEGTTLYINVDTMMGGTLEGNGTVTIGEGVTVETETEYHTYGYIDQNLHISQTDKQKIIPYQP